MRTGSALWTVKEPGWYDELSVEEYDWKEDIDLRETREGRDESDMGDGASEDGYDSMLSVMC